MAYAQLIESEGIRSQFLAVLEPRRRVTTWTNPSGSIYTSTFSLGQVVSVEDDGALLTEAASASVSAGQFYFDPETSLLTLRLADSSDPDNSFMVVTYEIYVGTVDIHTYRVPTDDTTREVYFEPLIRKSPQFKATLSDSLFGFLPSQSSTITLSNSTDHILEEHLRESSFNRARISIYHTLDDFSAANTKKIFNGTMGDVTYGEFDVTISVFDRIDQFSEEFRQTGTSFFSESDFPSIDPNFIGRPIRRVYGVVDGFIPVNIDYNATSPTTSDNRDWVVQAEQSNKGTIQSTVPASPTSTTTRTYLASANGFRVGDTCRIDKTTDESIIVTAVNKTGSHYIEHAALSSGAAASGDIVIRPFVGRIDIDQDGTRYTALYVRDYVVGDFAENTTGFQFLSGLESNLGMSRTLSPSDIVSCRVYGQQASLTIGSTAVTNDAEAGVMANIVAVLYQLLVTYVGVPTSDINTTNFEAALSTITDAVGFAIPSKARSNFPKMKELIADLLSTGLIRLYLDSDLKWSVEAIGPLGADDYTVENDEILEGSLRYRFSYKDVLSEVNVEYGAREIGAIIGTQDTVTTLTGQSQVGAYLHKQRKTQTFPSVHFKASEAQTLLDRLLYIFGDQRGELSITSKNRFLVLTLDGVLGLNREKLPGFSFVSGTTRSRSFKTLETARSLDQVQITLDDQKGIEDNSASW